MAIIRKSNTVGRDKPIDNLQAYLFSKLAFTNWQSYPRIYKNPKDGTLIPEKYTEGGEYEEVYFDDNVNVSSFFVASDEVLNDDNFAYSTNISIVFQVDLNKVYPSVTDKRPDELFNNDVSFWLNRNPNGFKFQGFVTGINQVYSGLNIEKPKLDDMSNFHVVRFNLFNPSFDYHCPSDLADATDGVVCPSVAVDDQGSVTDVPSGGSYTCTVVVQDIVLNFPFENIGDDQTGTATITSFTAGTYTSIADDGASGTITVSVNGGGFVAFSTLNPLILVDTDTVVFKRTITTAIGFVNLTGTYA